MPTCASAPTPSSAPSRPLLLELSHFQFDDADVFDLGLVWPIARRVPRADRGKPRTCYAGSHMTRPVDNDRGLVT
jgi:hypothetical protein